MSKADLIALVLSYDEKVKLLTQEVAQLSKNNGGGSGKGGDKYKALARRLKEERNKYKETCDSKLAEQDALKSEIEKMTDMIAELRDQCQALQEELTETRDAL